MSQPFRALFIAEGTSDGPLAAIVEDMFLDRGMEIRISTPDMTTLPQTARDLHSRFHAGRVLMGDPIHILIAHRDSDRTSYEIRRAEIQAACDRAQLDSLVVPVVPVRMTEAWLLLDEEAIRKVAGNPRGRNQL
jgi:hypothetical protein